MKPKKTSHKSAAPPVASRSAASRPSASRRSPSVDDLLGMVELADAAAESGTGRDAAASSAALLLSAPVPRVAKITGLDASGRPLLKLPGAKGKPLAARSTLHVTQADLGRDALVFFENGDASLPIITGLLEAPTPVSRGATSESKTAGTAASAPEKLTFEAGQELVLKVGKASITLTKDGRVVIRGADVLTRSSGSNRIKGGAVHIN